MNPVIYFRLPDKHYQEELDEAAKHFPIYTNRAAIPPNSLVIPRYSALPFYKELEEDLNYSNSKLLLTHRQHRYIADISSWYLDFIDVTPKTYFNLHELPSNTKFILKGETNSKKYNWNTHMFANNKQEAGTVYSNLQRDGLIQNQSIYIREYIPLRTFTHDVSGLPITEEYRFFIFKNKIVASGFYWASHEELVSTHHLTPKNVPQAFLDDLLPRVEHLPAVVIDIARTQDNNWIVIELNDLQQSGLSLCNSSDLYCSMRQILNEQ